MRIMPSKKGRRPKHKYRAIAVEYDGFRFDSKKEARRYNELKFMKNQGKIVFFLRQVPLHLPGRVIYRVDFQIFWADGTVSFEDVKGYRTKEYIAKKKLVEAHYPIEIEEV